MIPDISICIITYNHESYIKRTLESVNSQKFKGSVEIIIGVDLSADTTAEIVTSYASYSSFPTEVIIHKERQGMFQNLFGVVQKAKGKYIAFLEGDDFWIDPYKLEKQFGYMEQHIDCLATGGGIRTLTDQIHEVRKWYNKYDQYYYIQDFLHANRMSFCTSMIRSSALNFSLFESLKTSPHLDWPIYTLLFKSNQKGHIKVFKDPFSIYRIHGAGVYSGVNHSVRKQNILKTMQHILSLYPDEQEATYLTLALSYQSDSNKTCPTIRTLNRQHLPLESVPSFYLHNFSKKKVLITLAKNIWLTPSLLIILYKKYRKRYSQPL